ncbi:SGNH/GDSL hydrolase family protein [Teichococcus oryzae]|uniref:SGNH/GDSL hydrolase family protein n=1 Tax=Teichococcus oryzae TaxID=1608942 RepID=A0A5B2TD75_9PROT|nr:SGNH/GDSL hydrolase family protein [Pseudoroseomonas oryzae]KAA2212456.1 SGNH/GDSL hydrolase family protein [Pseudoroseomonas oryzae]
MLGLISAARGGRLFVADAAPLVLVGNRCSVPARDIANPQPGRFNRWRQNSWHRITEPCSELEIRWNNITGGRTLRPGASEITLRAAAPKPRFDQPSRALAFSGGRGLLAPDGQARAFVPMAYPAGDMQLAVEIVWAEPPGRFPGSDFPAFGPDEVSACDEAGQGGSAVTAQGFAPYGRAANYLVLPPTAILGRPLPGAAPRARIAVLGDSISSTGAAGASARIGACLHPGFLLSALADADLPYINLGAAGLSLAEVMAAPAEQRIRRFGMLCDIGITHMVCLLGQNDQAARRNAEQFLGDLERLKRQLDPLGIRLIPGTSWPRTDPGNSAPSQQAPEDSWLQLDRITRALRERNGVGYGFFDVEAVFGDPDRPRLWRSDKGGVPKDGIHPGDGLHQWARKRFGEVLPVLLAPPTLP